MLRHVRILLVAMLLVACGASQRPRPTTGAIVGLVRDRDSGDSISKAEIRVRGAGGSKVVVSDGDGMYDVDQLAPGRYDVFARFAGQPIEVTRIDVTAGEATAVDLVFTLGRPDPIKIDWQNLAAVAIQRYRPKHLTTQVAMIEGTVNDLQTKQRVAGAVITAVGGDAAQTQQTISDDRGRFKFEHVPPGVYAVSAYYSVSGRGQIEVLRSGIQVAGAEAVIVPLWIELTR
jgi:hypothetical protein